MIKKEELLKRGFVSIGNDRSLEYLARKGEHGEIQFVPISKGETTGIIESHSVNAINLLHTFIQELDRKL